MIALRTQPTRQRKPRIPGGIRIYAIGDIHGRVDLLDELLSRIDADLTTNPISIGIEVYLGDYIDRGPASREVLDRLVVRARTFRSVFLKGNHETYVPNFISDPRVLKSWQQFGGAETLVSYGITPPLKADLDDQIRLAASFEKVLPGSHRRFLSSLKPSFTCGDFFFVHAGIRPGVPLAKQREEDLLWIRNDFLLCEDDFSKIIIHGHTPVLEPDIRQNRINIDTGAYATGRLTCLKLEDDRIEFL